MSYNIKLELTLDAQALSALLSTLDNGPHRLMRPIIDGIIGQAQAQDRAAQEAAQPPAEPAPGVDQP